MGTGFGIKYPSKVIMPLNNIVVDYNHINHSCDTNTYTNTYSNTQANTNAGGLSCSCTNCFINFWLRFFEGKDAVLKSLCEPYYLIPSLHARRILWYLRSLSLEIRKKTTTSSQYHLSRAWRHPHSRPISCLRIYYEDGDCYILCMQA